MTDLKDTVNLNEITGTDITSSKTPETPQTSSHTLTDVVPAVEVELYGQHLIEASAGTGKTWTLTGIVLRLLIEGRRAPEQIIATTFTRAAAAEMRQRIHDRLVDFYQLLQWVNSLSGNIENKAHLYPDILQIDSEKESVKETSKAEGPKLSLDNCKSTKEATDKIDKQVTAKEKRSKWLVEQAEFARLDTIMKDPINLHLVSYLLDHSTSYSLDEAIRRTALVLTTLDNLFVGTLDSLAQKWLNEYSSETGHQQGMSIIEDASIEQVTDSIIHDKLRQFQSKLYHEQPKLYDLMEQKGKLTNVNDHKKYVSRSLNFISAPIDEVQSHESFDFDKYEHLLTEFAHSDLEDIQPYLNPDFRKSQGFNGRSSLFTRFESLLEIHQKIAEYKVDFTSYLSEDANKFLQSLKDARYPDEDGKIKNFNKNKEQFHQAFYDLETIKRLMAIIEMSDGLDDYIVSVLAHLNREIVLTVRDRLPIILEERGETTFSLQMVRLNKALTGKQGHKLARYIRHHYPIALIDESQDINGEQAIMIESIYLAKSLNLPSDKNRTSESRKPSNEFLLLVGDPKQAIYGFRGGDVANYNYMKRQFNKQQIWSLDVNRRSNAKLINALNHWFSMPDSNTSENRLAQLGDSIYYHHIKADKQTQELSWFHNKALMNSPLTTEPKFNRLSNERSTELTTELFTQLSTKVSENQLVTEVLSTEPLSLIHLPYDNELAYDEHETTARHIATLLNSGQTLKGKPILPSDIGVLARAKKDLKRVEHELVKLNVPTLTTSDVSIFETIMAQDVAALLSAMLHPYRHDIINRVLTSHLFGLSIPVVNAMMTDHESGITEDEGLGFSNIEKSLIEKGPVKKSYQDFISYLKEGAQRWQKFGVLSALHYLFDKSPVQPKGVWQALATLPEGDRHIMDLRHVMDVLAQYGIGMGEHELAVWFRQNIDAAPNSDWAKQYPLPTDSGVQLMTIHKSKGLEFPIVYVLGMGDASRKSGNKEQYGLYLYNAQQAASNQSFSNPSSTKHQASNQQASNPLKQYSGNQRRFSPVKGSATDDNYYTDMETKENFDELRRLGYVAFTRASEQLYVVLQDPKDKKGFDLKPVFYWFESQAPNFELPDRLKSTIGLLRGPKVTEFYDNYVKSTKSSSLEETQPERIAIKYKAFNDVMKQSYFYGWAKTSFTALARQLDESTQALAVADERMDDATDIDIDQSEDRDNNHSVKNYDDLTPFVEHKASDDIRFSFVRGANAGTFLHEIFEKIDFTHKEQWSSVIDRAVSGYQLPLIYASTEYQQRILESDSTDKADKQHSSSDALSKPDILNLGTTNPETTNLEIGNVKTSIGHHHDALQEWIDEVLHTPLLASGQRLIDIAPTKRFAELGFNMGLSESFKAEAINDTFKKHLADETDKHVVLTPQNNNNLYRYLRGEIDLVYEHAGKFYVVDYKSNYLGNSLSNYDEPTLKKAMSKAGYWLQAAIYQVALHRFLSIRIKDYIGNEDKYLGPVEYVFLRGAYCDDRGRAVEVAKSAMEKQSSNMSSNLSSNLMKPQTVRYGLVTWDVPIEFVKALDALFGKPQR